MRTLFRALVLLLIALPVALGVTAYLSVQEWPLVNETAKLTPRDVERAKQILTQHDPRKLKAGMEGTISVSERDLNLVAGHLVTRYGKGGSRIKVDRGRLALQATVELPRNPVGRFLNLDIALRQTDSLPRFEHLRVGRVPVPSWFANVLVTRMVDALYNEDDRQPTSLIKGVALADGRLRVTYEWQPELVNRLRVSVVGQREEERLKVFHEHLAKILNGTDTGQNVSLARLIEPIFKLGHERSRDGDAVADNRAAIIVLSAYLNGGRMKSIVPAAAMWSQPAQRKVILQAREDLAQHFMTSAALAVTGGGVFSDAVGLFKEVDDSRGGSGFSFTDLAADRAGTRFGELATDSTETARKVQDLLHRSLRETDFMPTIDGLPEFLPEVEFKRRFAGMDSPAYNRVIEDIEQRIGALALYR